MNNSNYISDEHQLNYEKAKEKMQELKSFYTSLAIYLIVNAGIVIYWFEYSNNRIQWFWFLIVGWGLGILIKALRVYDADFIYGKNWEKRKIKEYMNSNKLDASTIQEKTSEYEKAKEKVDKIRGFHSHLVTYIVVNTFIVTTIVWNSSIELLSFAALATPIFWGIGLVSHAFGVFGENLIYGKNWERRKIEEFINEEKLN